MTEYRTLLSNFIKKSTTVGLMRNDGTVDTTDYVSTSNTEGLIKNDGTIDTTSYLSAHQDITGKEDKSNKVTSISSSSTDTEYPSAKVVYDTIEPKLAKSDTKTLDSQYMVYGAYNSWEIVEVFGLQEMANQVIIDEDSIEYMDFEGVLKFTNNTSKRLLLNLRLGLGNSSEHYYSFDRENYIDLSSTETTITLESDEFVYLYCDSGNSTVLYSVRSDKNTIGTIVDMIYPVGSIYMNVNPTDPQILFGGTWTRLKDRFLLGSGDTYANGSTGGSATVTLTSAQSGLKAHGHGMDHNHNHRHSLNKNFSTGSGSVSAYTVTSNRSTSTQYTGYDSTASSKKTTDNNTASNASEAHENMPPYLTVYMWKRIG